MPVCPECKYQLDAFEGECPRCKLLEKDPAAAVAKYRPSLRTLRDVAPVPAAVPIAPRCIKCGTEVTSTTKFCPECGDGLIPAVGTRPSLAPVPPPLAPPVSAGTPSSHSAIHSLIVSGLVLVAFAIGIWFLANSVNNSRDPEGNPIVAALPKNDIEIRAEYETEVRDGLNRKLEERNARYTCTEVSLVKESERKYSGFARFSDDDTIGVEVLIDDDGRMIWRSGR